MHDHIITSYNMDFVSKELKIYTKDEDRGCSGALVATGVLTHFFEMILEYNIILSIDEYPICEFVVDKQAMLAETKQFVWPTIYETPQELSEFLCNQKYKYIVIDSSYGLLGWILAKDFRIELEYD